jgi:hypothetical protein
MMNENNMFPPINEETDEMRPDLLEKVINIDQKITQIISIVKDLGEKGRYDVVGVFLGNLIHNTLNHMKSISVSFPHLNNGLTKMGSDTLEILKTRESE